VRKRRLRHDAERDAETAGAQRPFRVLEDQVVSGVEVAGSPPRLRSGDDAASGEPPARPEERDNAPELVFLEMTGPPPVDDPASEPNPLRRVGVDDRRGDRQV